VCILMGYRCMNAKMCLNLSMDVCLCVISVELYVCVLYVCDVCVCAISVCFIHVCALMYVCVLYVCVMYETDV